MTVLSKRTLNGKPYRILVGAPPSAASSYTSNASSTGGNVGAPITLTFAPVGGSWPAGEVITPSVSGVTGTFSPATIAASGSGVATCTFTPAEPGTALLSSSTSPAMTDDTGALAYTVNGAGGDGGGSAPGALTDIVWHQPFALDPIAPDYAIAGWLSPVGGIGPYTWAITDNDCYTPYGANGTVRVFAYAPNTKPTSFTAVCTDARGVSVSKVATVNLASGSPTLTCNDINPANNCTVDTFYNGPLLRPTASGSGTLSVTLRDGSPSTQWTEQYGLIRWYQGGAATIPAATYPLTLHYNDGTDRTLNYDLQIVAPAPIDFIEFIPGTVSTSMLANAVVGRACATTPNNAPSWTLADASGTFQIDRATGIVSVAQQPASAGPVTFTITVADATATYTQSFTVTVQQGTTLPSGNMSFAALTTSFFNDTSGNVLGAPAVSGVTGTKQWSLVSQTGFNPTADGAFGYSNPARYAIDASTGQIAAAPLLSAGLDGVSAATDQLVVSCTDGINTCTATLPVTVNWAAVSKTVHIGRGKAAVYGQTGAVVGYETVKDAKLALVTTFDAVHAGTYKLLVYWDSDPDYYNDMSGYGTRYPWAGPIIIEGVPSGSGDLPRTGGLSTNLQPGGVDGSGKAYWQFGNGDFVLRAMEVSCVHGDNPLGGLSGVTKNGASYGNSTVQNCVLRDNDVNILAGHVHGQFFIDHCEFGNFGTEHSGAGALHGIYLDGASGAEICYNVFRRGTFGHNIKSRASGVRIHHNRIFDGLSGSASSLIDLCEAGVNEVDNNVIVKGPMALGPNIIQFGEEALAYSSTPRWQENTLSVHDNTIVGGLMAGGHPGGPNVVFHVHVPNAHGVGSTATIANNAIWNYPGGAIVKDDTRWTAQGSTTVSGNTTLALPPTIDMTRPYLPGNLPALGPLFYHTLFGQDDFNNFESAYQYQDRDQIVVASAASAGTALCTIHATNHLAEQGAGTANPWGPGTTWSIITDGVYYPEQNPFPNPWAAAGKYAVSANGDGSAVLSVAGALATGVDYVQLRATAPNGALSDSRYPVVVT